MRRVGRGLQVALVLALGAALATEAPAFSGKGGRARGGGHRMVSTPFAPHPFPAHSLQGHPIRPFPQPRFHQKKHSGGAFGFFGVATTPLVVYAPPVAYAAPAYAEPPAYYAPTVTNIITVAPAPAPTAPPPPSVVEFSTGRYELRGDGITAPYAWVWVPNPPPAPPSPPPAPPAVEAPAPAEPPAPRRRQALYRWTDEQGVLHLTDRWEIVPREHRGRFEPPS
jgi:hypothetical protein